MEFQLSEERRLIQETVRKIVQKEIAPRASEIDQTHSFPWANLKTLAEAGHLGINIPMLLGGSGGDRFSFVLVTEEIARACASTALIFVSHTFAGQGILVAGTEEQRKKYLPLLATGEKIGAFAVHEPNSGCLHTAIETKATLREDSYQVNGSKIFTTSGGEAQIYLVLTVTDKSKGPQGISMLIIEKGTPGFQFGKIHERMGVNGTSSCDLIFEDCRVPKENLLGEEGNGLQVLGSIVGGLVMYGAAAIPLGIAAAALDASIKHARQRMIAGKSIGSHQAIQFLIAEMSLGVDSARALLYSSMAGTPMDAMKAKWYTSEMAQEVTHKALQIHGGHGYCRDLPVERYYRDVRVFTLHFKTTELIKEDIGKSLLGL